MAAIVKLARFTQVDLKARASSTQRVQLLTIPYSHYCELARWSLEVADIEYDEHGYSPGAHVLQTLALRVGDARGKAHWHLSKSSSVQKAAKAPAAKAPAAKAPTDDDEAVFVHKRRPNSTAVPVLCLPDGSTVLSDSWAVAEHCFRGGANAAGWPAGGLKECLDEELGVLARQLAYVAAFRPANLAVWDGLCLDSAGCLFGALYRLGGGGVLRKSMISMFRADDEAATADALERLRAVVVRIEATWLLPQAYAGGRVSSTGWTVGGGSAPAMADYAMAALAAVLVLPQQYCAGRYAPYFDQLIAQDAVFRAQVEEFRATALGRHCAKMYEEYR
jgi:glutathione S-transferase